jgi:protein-arginine kinase
LLEPYQKIQSIKALQMKDAYLTFMQNAREKRRDWGPEEWVYAEEVMARLNTRRDQLDAQIPTKDHIRIQTLKTEFGTLKAGRNAKEIIKK